MNFSRGSFVFGFIFCLFLTFLRGLLLPHDWERKGYHLYRIIQNTTDMVATNSAVRTKIRSNLQNYGGMKTNRTGGDFEVRTYANFSTEEPTLYAKTKGTAVTKTKGKNDVTRGSVSTSNGGSRFQEKKEVSNSSGLFKKEEDTQSKVLDIHISNIKKSKVVAGTNNVRNVIVYNWRNLPQELYQLAPYIFDSVPKEFIPQYKNPCWYDGNWRLLCMPYFYILGFPKCGTSDLSHKINQHPQLEPMRWKDDLFWKTRRIGYEEDFERYINNSFSHRQRLLSGDTQAVFGDSTAGTVQTHFRYVPFFPNVTNGMYTTADIIKEITPKAKMLISIREPVARLYSTYLFYNSKVETSPFLFHMEAMYYIFNFKRCLNRSSKLRCLFEKVEEEGAAQRLKYGAYAPFIKDWVRCFGFDQLMVIRLEDWEQNCVSMLPDIFRFFELESLSSEQIESICRKPHVNDNTLKRKSVGEMLPSTKQLLQDFYAPFNKELSEFLNIPEYHVDM